MTPTLDLSRATHAKMLVSPPRINLRRAASYNYDRGPLSSTSSRFGFEHLAFSPPPSPSLPALIPRHRKSPTRPRPSRVLRFVVWFIGLVLVVYTAVAVLTRYSAGPVLSWVHLGRQQYEMIGQDELPDFATPIVVSDKRGKAKWTVYIPPQLAFPLSVGQYADICAKCDEVSGRVNALRSQNHAFRQISLVSAMSGDDQHFLDAAEARKSGLLPASLAKSVLKAGHAAAESTPYMPVGEDRQSLAAKPICTKSMTFVLESSDAGLGKTLMLLWVAYAKAMEEGRAFFIDDTRWAYGRYTDLFHPPPPPPCRPPPAHEILPCPKQARHLVVSAATAAHVLDVTPAVEDGDSAQGSKVHKEMFELARLGHDALFRLIDEDTRYVEDRVRELKSRTLVSRNKGSQNGLLIGVHVRHGDRHPMEYQYRRSYMPTNHYTERARDILDDRFNNSGANGGEDRAAKAHSRLVLASDDPLVYEHDDFRQATSAQEKIKLASKAAIQQANPDKSVMHKFVDETFGWDGGFFAPMFWNLGSSSGRGSADAESGNIPSPETMRLRSLVGRAYMMDLAVLADASDYVVCTVSAMGCRMLAVMMGSDSAFANGRWINIDGEYGWMAL